MLGSKIKTTKFFQSKSNMCISTLLLLHFVQPIFKQFTQRSSSIYLISFIKSQFGRCKNCKFTSESQGLNIYLAMSITSIYKGTKGTLQQGEEKNRIPTGKFSQVKTICIPSVVKYRLTSIVFKNYLKKKNSINYYKWPINL